MPEVTLGAAKGTVTIGDAEYVCWSRIQAEAGQSLEAILARKECERSAGDGLFFWGVGNAPAVIIDDLARKKREIPVVFSIMKSKAKKIDTSPARIVIWRQYLDGTGVVRPLPKHALVTSRGDSSNGEKKYHFALICRSNTPLKLEYGTEFNHHYFRNASGTGAPVGASQVTVLLKPTGKPSKDAEYEVNLRATLSNRYWVRLTDPLELSEEKLMSLQKCQNLSVDEWCNFVSYLRDEINPVHRYHTQLRLL